MKYQGNNPIDNEIRSRTVTAASVTITRADQGLMILCDCTANNVTLNLPALATLAEGFPLHVKKIDNSDNIVILDGNASETINGRANINISNQWDGISIIKSGSQWVSNGISTTDAGINKTKIALLAQIFG